MKIIVSVLALIIWCFLGTYAEAGTRQFYLDLLDSIDRANIRARLSLDSGTWRSTVGDTEIKWVIQPSTSAQTALDYNEGLLQKGQIIFEDQITAVVKRTVNQQIFCVVFKIKRIDYSEQGYIEPTSELNPQPASDECNGSAGRPELQTVAAISDDKTEVFSGRPFRGMGKIGKTVQCFDSKCNSTKPDIGPIHRVQLLGTTNVITLLGGHLVRFPTAGSITTDSGSRLAIERLDYDVSADAVDGQIKDGTVNISDGSLKAGGTELTFSGGGSIQNAEIKFAKTEGAVVVSGGKMAVVLGPNTIINLVSHPKYPTAITLDRATATFSDLQISFSGPTAEVGARYADLQNIQVRGAILGFSESNSLSIGPTSFGALLGCEEGQTPGNECLGFTWSNSKPTVIGRISGLNASLRGGTFAIGGGGSANLEPGGTVQADNLYVDTRLLNSAKNPIRGSFTNFEANISGQAIALDKDNKINSAKIHLQSNNLAFQPEDKYPVGTIVFDGSLSGASNGTFGNIPMADGTISFRANRELNGPVGIADGKLTGKVVFRDGPASATANVALDNAVFSGGFGRADFSLEVGSATYTIRIPQEKQTSDNVDWDRKEIVIPLNLLEPISITNQPITIDSNKWKIPEITRTFKMGFSLRNEELLYLFAHKDIGISRPGCYMKVKYIEDSYLVSGDLKISIGGGNNSIVIDNLNLNKGIAVDPDLGSCGDVIDVACGLVGSVILGPIGIVAAEMICHKKIEGYVADLSNKFKEVTKQKVNDLHFRASF